ncbi:MAG: SHOCT domain-containing protein [bacterium]
MTGETPSPYAAKSDAELAAMEQDKSLPIDVWMEVEAERGRRRKANGSSSAARAAPPSSSPPAAQSSPSSGSAEDTRVDSGLKELNGLLVPGERLLSYAVQRRLFALFHRRVIIGATTGRFIGLYRGTLGGYTPFDVRWQDLKDVNIRAGIFGANLTIASLATDDFGSHEHGASGRQTFMGLRKEQAQQVYKICQAQEQSWREKRRVRDLDELRAESGGVQFGSMPMMGGGGVTPSANADPTERLRRAKEMLDNGLITDTEYESIKARIVDAL